MGHSGFTGTALSRTEQFPAGQTSLEGELTLPLAATGIVIFAHGSGSSRHSPRNQFSTLLLVGELDLPVIKLNDEAYARLRCEKQLRIIPGDSSV